MAMRHLAQRALHAIGLKAASDMFWPRSMLGFGASSLYYPMGGVDASGPEVGLGLLRSSVLMAPILWLMRAWPEAELVVRQRKRGQTEYSIIDGHPLAELLRMPNAYYSGEALWMVSVWSWCVFGNVYWRIVSTRGGVPREIWWVPPWQIRPAWPADGREFISYYEYAPEVAGPQRLSLDEVIHFRHSLDPQNPRVGLSPIASVLREVAVDDEASSWVAALLHNSGVPGLIITPQGENFINPEELERVKAHIEGRFTGENRGRPMALGAPTAVHKLSFTPNEMDLSPPRNTAEERVCACFGLPPAVVGFGTGLETVKVGATMREMVGLAWSNALIPPQRTMAGELQRILLPRFERAETQAREVVERRLTRLEVGWDYSNVLAMQEDAGTKLTRYNMGVQGGWIKVSEARAAANLEVSDEDDIYLRPRSMEPVDPLDQMPTPEPIPAPLRILQGRDRHGERTQQSEDGEEEEAEEADYAEGFYTKQGTIEEFVNSLIGRHAGHLETIPPHLLRLADRQWRRERALQPKYAQEIGRVLRRYGDMAATAAREVLAPKQSLQDLVNASIITERMSPLAIRAELEAVYTRLYGEMFRVTEDLLAAAMDVERTDPRLIQGQLSELARERVGLLDLPRDARQAILRSLEEARAQGLTEDGMMDLIRERVPAGRWGSVETRARVIARSETRFAANVATTHAAEQAGTNRVLVLDARLGPTDTECEIRNGWIVSPAEARQLAGVEHPNGTLGLLPLTPAMLEPPAAVPAAAPEPVSLEKIMAAGRRLDRQWQQALGPDYPELVARRDRLAQLNRELGVQFDHAERIAERSEIRRQKSQVYAELQSVQDTIKGLQRPTLHAVLSEVRPLGQVEARWTAATNDAVARSIADVADSLPRDWLQRSREWGAMDGQVVERGYYSAARKEIRLSGSYGSAHRTSNAFHELGHRFEEVVPNIFEMEDAFYKKRTARPTFQNRLRKLGPGYEDYEMTRPDRFVHSYMGKAYPNQRNYELLSMGLESVFTGSYDLSKDPEFRRFILGVLATL